MSILLIDFNDITIEQLLSQLNPVIELGGERAELACRYDERQGWVVGYVVADVAKWAKLPGGSRFFVANDLKKALWLLRRGIEDLEHNIIVKYSNSANIGKN